MSTSLPAVQSSEGKVTLLQSILLNLASAAAATTRPTAHRAPLAISSATRPDILAVVHPPGRFEKHWPPILRLSGGGIAYCSEWAAT